MSVKATLNIFYPTTLNYRSLLHQNEGINKALEGLFEVTKNENMQNWKLSHYEFCSNSDSQGFYYYFKEDKNV